MAKNNDKRAERMARSNRNVNRAITVLMAGVIAEFYLLNARVLADHLSAILQSNKSIAKPPKQ